jgi:hypothetical protein
MNLNPAVTLDAGRLYVISLVQRGKNTPSVNGCSSRVVQSGVEWQFTTGMSSSSIPIHRFIHCSLMFVCGVRWYNDINSIIKSNRAG